MNGVEIDMEEMIVKTSVSITTTFKELAAYFKGNDSVLNSTFPLFATTEKKERASVLDNQFVGEEHGVKFYTIYPWEYILIDGR